jgi:lysozyme
MNTFTTKGKTLLEHLEKLELDTYLDEANVYTIGYGHTGPEVLPGLHWTKEQADEELDRDLEETVVGVADLLGDAELTDNQFSALVLFAFNIGLDAFAHSTMLRYIRAGLLDKVPDEFKRWNKVHKKGGGLVTSSILTNRRKKETDLWNTPDESTDQEPNT